MRIVPVLIAVIVSAMLYAVVFERDRLEQAVGIETQADTDDADVQTELASTPTPERERAVSVVAVSSRAQQIDSAVVLRGRTEPARTVDVAVEVSGRIISAPLRRGVSVNAGDVLCQLDPGTAEVTLAEARARLAEAEITANAATELAEEGFVSATRRASTAATLESARAAVRRAERAIEDLTVTAPFGGVLEDDTAELGAYLSPQGGNGGQCARILQLDPIKIVGFVPETLVSQVSIGAPARARLSDGQDAEGTVRFIARQADETTRTFRVEVEVANPDLRLRAGQTAEVAVAAAGKSAHLLPASALTLDDDGRLGVRHVVQSETGTITGFTPVSIVRDSTQGVWLAGLPDEIDVIVVGQDFVTAGTPLTVTMREPAT
ncbi:efflux RND transporter periplasmic adaptor subunit [Tropicimonas sp. S265A]|uniref:efflux RND transporter periplasmic adaptor subunit n=1 Tax=Tropicimonas sp. S265A TaxID=3415134 RepID=UPI003C7C39A1